MAFVETANLKTKDKKGSFLGDVLATVGPMALGALGSIASGGMSQIGGGLVSSILGGGNESTKAMGGNIPQMTKYASGGSHEQNGLGGIPVDSLGNPSGNPSALVEQGEVGYKLPNDQTGYVFSNRIKVPGKKHTFADEAKRVASRYKNRLGENLDKPDSLAKRALDMAMNTLKDSQEAVKQQEQEAMAVKALGGYLNELKKGGVIEEPPTEQEEYVSKLQYYPQNDVSERVKKYPHFYESKVYNGNARKSPTYKVGYDESVEPGIIKPRGSSIRAGGYGTADAALTSILSDKGMRDIAVDNAMADSLNKFLPPPAIAAIDSLNIANFRDNDTTGRHAAIENIAKRFPQYVEPSKVFKQEDIDRWRESLGDQNAQLGFAHNQVYTNPTKSDLLTGNKTTKGTLEEEERRGFNKWGVRNAAGSHMSSYRTFIDTQPVSTTGETMVSPKAAALTTPINYDIPSGEFSARVSNISGVDPAAIFSQFSGDNYSMSQVLRQRGKDISTKSYGGGLPKYDGTDQSQLPNEDKSNYLKYHSGLPEAYIGYGLQAATRIPQLFTKPESIHYDRVNPETIDLAQERGSMETSRNNQLGFLKRQAGMAGSAGQALNYLSSVVPQAYNQYDQQYAQSIEREQNANAQIMNQANAQNAQIQMREAEANAMERDAARGIRDQALADIGKTGLGALTAKKSALEQYNSLKMQGAINDYGVQFGRNSVDITRNRAERNTSAPLTGMETSIPLSMDNPYLKSLPLDLTPRTITPSNPNYWDTEEIEEEASLKKQKDPASILGMACGGSLKKCKGGYLKKKGKK